MPAGKQKQWLARLAIGIFLGLLLYALLTGKLNWIGALVMGVIPFLAGLWRWISRGMTLARFWQSLRGKKAAPHTMGVTLFDQAKDGELHTGPHAGRRLSALSATELDEALRFFRAQQPAAADLLTLYIAQRFGPEWTGSPLDGSPQGAMTVAEARALLGVAADADKAAIISAHRRLIQKFHPDRGGNDYLAARLNLAKDLLLKHLAE